jgi:hypothetical protein
MMNKGQEKPEMMNKGPNDARRIIRALGTCFLFFS